MRTCQYRCSHLILEFPSASQESGCTHPEASSPLPQTPALLLNPARPQSHSSFIHGLPQFNQHQPRARKLPQIPHRQTSCLCFCDEILKGERVCLDSWGLLLQLVVVEKLRQQVIEAAGGITSSQETGDKQNAGAQLSFSTTCCP